jgi:hypothetical protein
MLRMRRLNSKYPRILTHAWERLESMDEDGQFWVGLKMLMEIDALCAQKLRTEADIAASLHKN